MVPFALQKLFCFIRSQLLIVDLSTCYQSPVQEVALGANVFKATSCFLFIRFSVSGIMLKSLIHLDLSFVQGDKHGSICILIILIFS